MRCRPLALAHWPGLPTWYVEESHGALPGNANVGRAVIDLARGDLVDPARRVVREAVDHRQPVHRAQPGELALGKLAGGVDAALAQFRFGDASFEEFPGLPVADAAHRG